MSRTPRGDVLDPHRVDVVHTFNRTNRQAFLLGDDPVSGKNYDHRKGWIERWLERFAAHFGIDLLSFAILSNHYHLVLRNRPDVVRTWSDSEVARRWLMICPERKHQDGEPKEPNKRELDAIRNHPEKLSEIRTRLSDVSWWMRLLDQRIAQRSNKEDDVKGRFFEDRFQAVRLIDEAAVLACAVYVDLNPIRAAIAQSLQESDHTSVQRRLRSGKTRRSRKTQRARASRRRRLAQALASPDALLAPVDLCEADGPVGPCPSVSAARCSDKGFLPIDEQAYLALLEWTARQKVKGKADLSSPRGRVPPILARLGLTPTVWIRLTSEFGRLFSTLAGMPERVDAARQLRSGRRFYLPDRTRELLQHAA